MRAGGGLRHRVSRESELRRVRRGPVRGVLNASCKIRFVL